MKKILLFILVVVIALPLAVIFLRPSAIISKEEAKKELSSSASHFIKWKGAEIHYTDEGSGFPILMVHGFGGSYRNFDKLADALKGQFRVVRFDLPGFGLSDFPAIGENEDFVKDYRDFVTFFLDTMHLDSLYVIGNSLGGGISWMAAADHPGKIKKLVLLNSAGYDSKKIAAGLLIIKYRSIGHVFDKGMPLFMSESGLKKGFGDKSKADMKVAALNNKFTNREGNIPFMLTLAWAQQFPDTNMIKEVKCPTLIVWGKEDEIIPVEHAERFHRDIPNSKVIIYDPCGHIPMVERTEDLTKDFLEFIKE